MTGGNWGRNAQSEACLACSGGAKSLHADGCFKLKELKSTGGAHGTPLVRSSIGWSQYNPTTNQLHDPIREKWRVYRRDVLGIESLSSCLGCDCPGPSVSMAAQKSSSKDHRVKGLFLAVCRHNIACTRTGVCIDTVSLQ